MIYSAAMIIAVAVCFVAAVLNLAVDSAFRRYLMRTAAVAAVLIGAVFYGHGFVWSMGLGFGALFRALLALCRMFGGINDLASVQDAPLFQYPGAMAVFWLGHFLAFYVMASTAIATLGEGLLRRIRVLLLRRGPLLLIYGVNADSIAYGRSMAKEKRRSVVFVDRHCDPALENTAGSFGAVIEKGTDALSANVRFLRSLNMGPGNRKLELAALHEDGRKNLLYARELLASMSSIGIRPEQTSLLASGIGDEAAALQALGGEGYGSVYAFDVYEQTARQMFREHPPCELIGFDGNGKAKEDLHALILGFGRMGRAVLSQLVRNGQFYGSSFRADVFDPGAQNGFLHEHPVMQAYDIRFHGIDGMSDEFFAFLKENRGTVKLIVLCTGTREKNHEIAGDLAAWFPWNEKLPLVLLVSRNGFIWLGEDRYEAQSVRFPDIAAVDPEEMDALAMQVNHIYCEGMGSMESARKEWSRCSYADRRSSRACADFYPAVLRASGRTEAQVISGDWPPQGEMLENLSVTEHMRWCAFQYVSGYAPMPEEVWRQRAEQYKRGAAPGFRIGRDDGKRLQACLIPWDELDALSERENAVTGGKVDYKQMDRNNILMLSQVLAAKQEKAEDAFDGRTRL